MFDLDAYLERIGLFGRPSIHEIHRAHVAAIPFENLDPLRGVPVSLDLSDLQAKLVAGRRGGYCFEHNRLLAAACEALGAEVELLLARVGDRDNPRRARSHLLLRVTDSDGVWHADVGFGAGALLYPIPFGPGEHEQEGWHWRVLEHGRGLLLAHRGADGEWADELTFATEPAPLIDLETSNWFTCTHPGSKFTQGLAITAHRADPSRITLSDWSGTLRLRESWPDHETVSEPDRAQIPALLAQHFGLSGWELDARGIPVPAGDRE